jgi:uncharacterized membrane protein
MLRLAPTALDRIRALASFGGAMWEGPWMRGLGLAAITGARTALGPALLCRCVPRPAWRRRRANLLAALELLGDKLPLMPYRTAPLGLVLRMVNGARVARALQAGRGRALSACALALGAAAAIAGAFGGLRLRLGLTRRLGGGALANAIAGTLEDAALIAIGARLTRPSPARG